MAGEGGNPGPGSLSESLLLEALNRLGIIEQRLVRTETQNETIIAAQASDLERHNVADESRGKMHQRINEISENVAGLSANVEALEALAPIVRMLQDAQIEKKTVRQVVRQFYKNGYVLTTGGVGAAAAAWHQWDHVRAVALRLLGVKTGGG